MINTPTARPTKNPESHVSANSAYRSDTCPLPIAALSPYPPASSPLEPELSVRPQGWCPSIISEYIEEIGLGGHLNLNCHHIDPYLCKWLFLHFDPQRHFLNVHGASIVFRPQDVQTILGLGDRDETAEEEQTDLLREYWPDLEGKPFSISLAKLEVNLLRDAIGVEEFKVKFAIFAIGCFVCLASGNTVYSRSLQWLGSIHAFKQRRWATRVFYYLVESVRQLKEGLVHEMSKCVFLFLVLYTDNVQVGCIPPPHLYIGAPRTATWRSKEVNQFMKELSARVLQRPPPLPSANRTKILPRSDEFVATSISGFALEERALPSLSFSWPLVEQVSPDSSPRVEMN